MKLKSTIRGIPLCKLASSGFLPAINVLANSWHERKKGPHPVETHRGVVSVCKISIPLALILTTLYAFFWKQWILTMVGLCAIVAVIETFNWVLYVTPFVDAVNRLDALLKKAIELGITELPESFTEIHLYVREVCISIAQSVLVAEIRDPLGVAAEHYRGTFKEFAKSANTLGLCLGDHKPMFDEAKKRLDASSAKKTRQSLDAAKDLTATCAGAA